MTDTLEAALDRLNRETCTGVEFLEALHRTLLASPEVSEEELTKAYDKQPFSQFLLAGISNSLTKNW